MQWYTVKVKYTKELEDGTFKKLTEPYLLQASSFTDAEARIHEEVISFIRGEFLITGISKTDFTDIFQYDDTEKWYKVKLQYVDINPDNGAEKKITQQFLINAHNVKEAFERMHECMKGLMVSFELPSIQLSPIVDIFPLIDEELKDRVLTEEEMEERHGESNNEDDYNAEETDESPSDDLETEETEDENLSSISDEFDDEM